MAALSRKTLKKKKIKFLRLCRKTTPYGKISKFCSKRIHRDTDRRVVFKFHEKKTKFPMDLQLSLLRGLHPKSARACPQHSTLSVPDFIEIGSLWAELFPNA